MKKNQRLPAVYHGLTYIFILALMLCSQDVYAIGEDDCMDCHSDSALTMEKNGAPVSLFVDEESFKGTVHAENGCLSCHPEAEGDADEHPSPMPPVHCGNCHDQVSDLYLKSLHGQALQENDPYAPACHSCHTKHTILPVNDIRSSAYVLNIPLTCGKCHQEGSDMTRTHDIPKKNILENYSMSIHGEGLFRKGLTVTAVCTSCHTSHSVLPHTDPNSTINRQNVTKTCMKCHANIEQVHVKIVRGEIWEKEPHKIPVCVECHGPHKARRVLYEDSMNDRYCMSCHGNRELTKINEDGSERSLYVDTREMQGSVHKEKRISCAKCHVNISHESNPVCKDTGPVDCSICHADQSSLYNASVHGVMLAKYDPDAPTCTTCHGEHGILPKNDSTSPIFTRNVPALCAQCHRDGEKAANRYKGEEHAIIKHYSESIHGKGLSESGLLVSATCTSCHTAHSILPTKNVHSSVNDKNILATCAQCHLGIAEQFEKSIHSPKVANTDKELPKCNTCHTSHTIKRVEKASFRSLILQECGNCHQHETDAYFDTYHGKASLLSGGEKTAKCSDCHGSHNILPPYYAQSSLSRANVVETCRKCHPDSNRKFTGYLTHATHHDRDKYPYLFYTFWAMTALLIGTFTFFGLHTLFWIPRSFRERFKRRRQYSHEKISDK